MGRLSSLWPRWPTRWRVRNTKPAPVRRDENDEGSDNTEPGDNPIIEDNDGDQL
jgi:hypothetical protein